MRPRSPLAVERRGLPGLCHRARAATRSVRVRSASIVDAQGITLALGDTLIAHNHLFLFAGINRKNAGTQHTTPHPFDEGWVALAPNDFFVDSARFLGRHGLARN